MSHDTVHATEHTHVNYVKIWAILVGLLGVSIVGPMFGIKAVTLITAFGIALVKAYLVAKNFMHVNVEQRFIPYIVVTGLVFMLLFYAGTAPDVMEKQGTNWEKPTWLNPPPSHAPAAGHEGEGAHP
jgi:caa(3)-type oxidase subunit IV